MDAAKSCSAAFGTSGATARLTISLSGNGLGQVTSIPSGISCGTDCVEDYPVGTMVNLSTVAGTLSSFASWSGDADCLDGVVTMSAARGCTAAFAITGFTAYWPMNGNGNESSGVWNGMLLGGVLPVPDRHGNSNAALSFNGTTGFIDVGSLHPPTSGFSVAFWMKPAVSTTTTGFSLENEIIGDAGGGVGFRVYQSGSNLVLQAQGPAGSSASFTVTPADTTRWSHIVAVYDGSRTSIYRDGSLLVTGSIGAGMGLGAQSFQIGRDPNVASSYWGGQLDEVYVFSRALSPAEIGVLIR